MVLKADRVCVEECSLPLVSSLMMGTRQVNYNRNFNLRRDSYPQTLKKSELTYAIISMSNRGLNLW